VNFLPQLLKGISFLIIGWLFIKLVLFFIKKALGFTNIDTFPEKLMLMKFSEALRLKFNPQK